MRLVSHPFPRSGSRVVRVVATAVLLALAFAAGSIFSALGDPTPATYSACVSAPTNRIPRSFGSMFGSGSLYNVTVDDTAHCNSGDTLISWNAQGPIGQTGATGATGPAGAPHDCALTDVYPGINLARCNLSNADLSLANLAGANLTGSLAGNTNFQAADLGGALMTSANLGGADLSYTSMYGANLRQANLAGADLSFSFLNGADLTGATLTGATLNGTEWDNTTCPDHTNSDDHGGTCIGHLTP